LDLPRTFFLFLFRFRQGVFLQRATPAAARPCLSARRPGWRHGTHPNKTSAASEPSRSALAIIRA